MLFWQFSNINIYVKIVGKIPDQYLNVCLFSNPGDKVQKRWRIMGQICPILSTRFWTLSPGLENSHTLKCWSSIFPTILTYVIMLENCQNNISVHGCSPMQGTKILSCWYLMKPRSQSRTYLKKYFRIFTNLGAILSLTMIFSAIFGSILLRFY